MNLRTDLKNFSHETSVTFTLNCVVFNCNYNTSKKWNTVKSCKVKKACERFHICSLEIMY